ncbi:MAG: hypothetical protein WBD78_16800, partial [Methylocella sp.]
AAEAAAEAGAAEAAAGEAAAAAAAGAGAWAAAACHGEVAPGARLEHLPITLTDAGRQNRVSPGSIRPTYVLFAALPTRMRASGVRRAAERVANLIEKRHSQKS